MAPNLAHENSTRKRTLTRLAPALDKQLLAYAAAASAAGIGLLAQPAEARVVYTAANVSIPQDGGGVHIDLNHDGISDFVFDNSFFQAARLPEGNFGSGLFVYGSVPGNSVWGVESKGEKCAAVLPKGVSVGPKAPFAANAALFDVGGNYTNGDTSHCKWREEHRGAFLGLKFLIKGETHYGWAHINAGANYLATPVINGYAYETIANKPIITGAASGPVEVVAVAPVGPAVPQPATLGLLARGERGLQVWRRPEDQVA